MTELEWPSPGEHEHDTFDVLVEAIQRDEAHNYLLDETGQGDEVVEQGDEVVEKGCRSEGDRPVKKTSASPKILRVAAHGEKTLAAQTEVRQFVDGLAAADEQPVVALAAAIVRPASTRTTKGWTRAQSYKPCSSV
jgi:hypothetical protein